MPDFSDEQIVAAIKARSTRSVLGEFVLALSHLLIHLEVPAEMNQVSVNFHGVAMRVDIARLTDDGEHLAEWITALNANPMDPAFASRVPLPNMGPVQ